MYDMYPDIAVVERIKTLWIRWLGYGLRMTPKVRASKAFDDKISRVLNVEEHRKLWRSRPRCVKLRRTISYNFHFNMDIYKCGIVQ